MLFENEPEFGIPARLAVDSWQHEEVMPCALFVEMRIYQWLFQFDKGKALHIIHHFFKFLSKCWQHTLWSAY